MSNKSTMEALNNILEPNSRSAISAPNITQAEFNTTENVPLMRKNKSEIFKVPNTPEAFTKGEQEGKEIDHTFPNKHLLQTGVKTKCVDSKLFLLAILGQILGCTIAIMLYLFILCPLTNNITVVNTVTTVSETISLTLYLNALLAEFNNEV